MNDLACASMSTRMLVRDMSELSLLSKLPNYAKMTSAEPMNWMQLLNETYVRCCFSSFKSRLVKSRPSGVSNSLKKRGNSVIGSKPEMNWKIIVRLCISDFLLTIPFFLSSLLNNSLMMTGSTSSLSSSASFGILSVDFFCFLSSSSAI